MDEITKCLIGIVAILLMVTYISVSIAKAEIKERKQWKIIADKQSNKVLELQQQVTALQEVVDKRNKRIAEKRRKALAENRKKRQSKVASVGVVEDDSSKQKSKSESKQAQTTNLQDN